MAFRSMIARALLGPGSSGTSTHKTVIAPMCSDTLPLAGSLCCLSRHACAKGGRCR